YSFSYLSFYEEYQALVNLSNDSPPTEFCTLSLPDALPISGSGGGRVPPGAAQRSGGRGGLGGGRVPGSDRDRQRYRWLAAAVRRSEEHTSELQSRENLVCRLLLEKKKGTYELAVKSQA